MNQARTTDGAQGSAFHAATGPSCARLGCPNPARLGVAGRGRHGVFCSDTCRARAHKYPGEDLRRQPTLPFSDLDAPAIPSVPAFAGPGYRPDLDRERLSRHCRAVLAVLERARAAGSWLTYEAIAVWAKVPPGSVRTRVSNLRAWGFGIEQRTREDRFREVRLA